MTTLLYSGNFGLGHELDTVLRAVHTLDGDVSLRVLLVGNGKGLAETRALVEELGLSNVEFRPAVPLPGLAELLAGGDIHVVSQRARTDGLIVPSKIYGSLAAGRPVVFIGPEHCEVARIVRDGRCGFVVEPGDVESTARVLGQLARDAELRRTMGQQAQQYYAENFGRKRSVAKIIHVIELAGGHGECEHLAGRTSGGERADRPSYGQTEIRGRARSRSGYGPVAAAITASFLVLMYGLTYRALAARLAAPASIAPVAAETLERLPLQIADWAGEGLPMDEEIAHATGADAYINRRYSCNSGLESVSLFAGCSVGGYERIIHRPEICYARSGWALTDRRVVELLLPDGVRLPCSIFQFSRGELNVERVTVLHYYVVDGQRCDDLSPLQSKLWRLGGTVGYVGRVLIACPAGIEIDGSPTERVCGFAIDSAPTIARLFQELRTDGGVE